MEDEKKDNQWTIRNNGSKGRDYTTVAGVVALVAIIAGVYAMVEPMSQRVDYLEGEFRSLRSRAATTSDHQLLNSRIEKIENWRIWWNREMLTSQMQMEEKIKTLERLAYGGALPQISGE